MVKENTIQKAFDAVKANVKPGIALWIILVIFMSCYWKIPAFKASLGSLGELKAEIGYLFSFTVYFVFAGILPEILKIIMLQNCRPVKKNLTEMVYTGLIFGIVGVVVDIFYKIQGSIFGSGKSISVLTCKTLVDQFIFSPIINTNIILAYLWREHKFNYHATRKSLCVSKMINKMIPIMLANWSVWIPGVIVIYAMPSDLQIPIASFILCFWVLIITFMSRESNQ